MKYIWLVLLILLVMLAVAGMDYYYINLDLLNPHEKMGDLHDFFLIILTLALVLIAWFQLDKLNQTAKAKLLLELEARFGSAQIVEARAILQRYAYEEGFSEATPDAIDKQIAHIADHILRVSVIESEAKTFAYLLNYLDFLEAASYLCRHNGVDSKYFEDLNSGSIPYLFKVYEPWIQKRRKKYNDVDNHYYGNLEWLARDLDAKTEGSRKRFL